jgi:hypothetical protein
MTLKEKFRPHAKYWDCYNDEPLKYDHENKCVKIADEFAIEFAEWLFNIDKELLKKQLNHFKQEKRL